MGDSFTTAAGPEAGGNAEGEAAGADGQRSWAAASKRRRQAAAAECRSAGLLGSKPRTVMMKESSLSADGRAWPNKPRVVNPEASRRDLTSGGAVHCCSRDSRADGSSRRCDMTT